MWNISQWHPTNYLDRTPMYTVVLHALLMIFGATMLLSVGGWLSYTPVALTMSLVLALGAALLTNLVCSYVCRVSPQHISAVISALIIVLLCSPVTTTADAMLVVVMSMLAMASKYVLVWKKQHITNPVAVAAVLATWFGFGGAVWWVATPLLFAVIIVAGALVVTKIHRWSMVLVFLLVGYGVYFIEAWLSGSINSDTWLVFFVSYPMLFMAAFMLTEPFTMPGTKRLQISYAVVVAILANTSLFNSVVFMTPELALVVGNIAFFPWSLRQKLLLRLQAVREVAPSVFEFTFAKPKNMHFTAGQYLEWMLPHQTPDERGVRRYFTIASAPLADTLSVAMKVPTTKPSSFKSAIINSAIGTEVIASQLAGDFVLPKNPTQKIGWIAGGIGVTPFVSQTRSMRMIKEHRDVILLYATASMSDTPYQAELQAVAKVINVVANSPVPIGGVVGYVTADCIAGQVPDYQARLWYVSGPPGLVNAAAKALRSLGVSPTQIKTDFFPGLA